MDAWASLLTCVLYHYLFFRTGHAGTWRRTWLSELIKASLWQPWYETMLGFFLRQTWSFGFCLLGGWLLSFGRGRFSPACFCEAAWRLWYYSSQRAQLLHIHLCLRSETWSEACYNWSKFQSTGKDCQIADVICRRVMKRTPFDISRDT